MLTNIRGLVDRLELGPSRGMMPLFEALSNAIDAIVERNIGLSHGDIRIQLVHAQDLVQQAGDTTPVIDGLDISDNGIGFDDDHLKTFEEAYTLAKVKMGGKGVGRFTFLKVFSKVSVRSVFEREGKHYMRSFRFSVDQEVQGATSVELTELPVGTKVSLRGLVPKYQSGWPKEPEIAAQRLIAHFLIRFAARSCPPIFLEAPDCAPIDLHRLFQETVQPHIEDIRVEVNPHVFSLQVFRNQDGRARHDLHYCANGREVVAAKLRDLLPELPERFVDEQQRPYTLKVLVTGEYLDDHANQERTDILFQSDDPDLGLDDGLVSRHELNRVIAAKLRVALVNDLKTTNVEKLTQIEKFVEKAPEYRVLTHEKHRPLLEQRIPPGLSEDKLDEHLLHLRREIEDSVRKEERDVAALMEKESFDVYKVRIQELIESMNDVGKAKLADYVAHRRTILDLVDKSLKIVQKDGKYPFERVLHKMIFPMGATSRDVFLEQQNLWLIDERLCFHTLLTSDKKLNSIRGLEKTSGKEPDILAFFYDTPIGVSEPEGASGGIVIVEFKRPGRDDYDKDPADQIIQRFVEISEGGVKDIEGRPVNPKNLRYIGYLIADLTPTLKKQVAMRYHETADGEGYFYALPQGNGYVEIISYDKLVNDAKRRNRVLFEKLGLHKH